MLCSLRNVDACLPITAIRTLNYPDARVVLAGQGPHVRLVDENSGLILANLRTFERNNVHGILIRKQIFDEDGELRAELLIWGGQSFRAASVTVWKSSTCVKASIASSSLEYEAPDWILDGDICSRDSTSGNPNVCLVTAHNALLFLDFKPGPSPTSNCTIGWHELATGLRSILYSADVNCISPEQVLVAAGTVFGEIIVWSCYLDGDLGQLSTKSSLSVHYYFTGHEGSIFGVNISPEVFISNENNPRRFLASCSDDRTIRIWDISGCPQSLNECSVQHATNGSGLRHTGFGKKPSDAEMNSKPCVAKTWAHSSRIWGVYFLGSYPANTTSLNLVSRGEDSTCQLWSLDFKPSESPAQQANLCRISTYAYHSGKHVWSLAIHQELGHIEVYTGGADGSLVSFRIQDVKHGTSCGARREQRDMNGIFIGDTDDSRDDIETSPATKKFKKKTKKEGVAAKCYGFVADDCFLTFSVRGDVRLGHISHTPVKISGANEANYLTSGGSYISLEKVSTPALIGKCPFSATLAKEGIAVACGRNRSLQVYDKVRMSTTSVMTVAGDVSGLYLSDSNPGPNQLASNRPKSVAILVSYFNVSEVDLIVNQGHDLENLVMSPTRLILPEDMRVTSFLYIEEPNCAIIGLRTGGLMVYRLDTALNGKPPVTSVYHRIHGDETVTFITRVRQPNNSSPNKEVILSCGRDGTYCVHILDLDPNLDKAVSLETVHQSSPPFGPNIEGAHFDEVTNDLILHGFRSKEFIVWNESAQMEILTVGCCGSSRLWAFTPRPDAGGAGTFIWTQASIFNMFSMESPSHRVLRVGNHGREIKTLSISNSVAGTQGRVRLLATGSEDTTIRLFDIDDSNATGRLGSFKCLRTSNKHIGGLQHLRWSPKSNFLFSSSGCEEFFVWKVQSVPGFGIGLVLEASCPKSKAVSDLRTINFDLLEVDDPDGKDCFLLCLAYSNSTVNVFHYSSSHPAGKFTLLASGVYTTNCLTQIQFVKTSRRLFLITCATDGHAATWDLTGALSPFYSITEANLRPQAPFLDAEEISPAEISWQHHHQIHQSSIKSMEIAYKSEGEALIISGGDDNALSISRIHICLSSLPTKSRCSTLIIPKAHASAINAVTIAPQISSSGIGYEGPLLKFTIASSGNDQRLKLWSVSVDLEQPGVDGIEVIPKADEFSAVADISGIGYIRDGDANCKKESILLAGVGMELWSVDGGWNS